MRPALGTANLASDLTVLRARARLEADVRYFGDFASRAQTGKRKVAEWGLRSYGEH
jgi:hypothetical protein